VTSAILEKSNLKMVDVNGRSIFYLEKGTGFPTVYLHGFADVHGVAADLLPFHHGLARDRKLLAPAHPGVNGSDDLPGPHAIEDVVFHYLQVFDALGLGAFDLVGHGVGGWIAAELAVRHPEKISKLCLIGACGLFVPGEPIADIFMHTQPERGVNYATLRRMLFASESSEEGLRYYPDGRGDIDEETRRYQMVRFCSFVGFKPPYLYNRSLIDRLARARMPALVIWGERDGFTPLAHGRAYAEGLPAAALEIVPGAGHSLPMERAEATAALVRGFLNRA